MCYIVDIFNILNSNVELCYVYLRIYGLICPKLCYTIPKLLEAQCTSHPMATRSINKYRLRR
jgi:hypothetical protein